MATTVSIRSLLDAGVHFGHQTRRWNPKMKPYIWGQRNGIHIIDLKQTLYAIDDAYTFLSNVGARGGKVLFVGTKKQAQEPLKEAAERAGQPYVNFRWMGGMLTNFQTIKGRVQRMAEIESMKESGLIDSYNKKEQAGLNKELAKLQAALGGIRDMNDLPAAVFIVDTNHEVNAVREARRLHIPIVGLVDTNCDPDEVDYGIPANDDAIRSVRMLCDVVADAVLAAGQAGVTAEEMAVDAPAEAASPEAAQSAPAAEMPAASVEVAEAASAEPATVEESATAEAAAAPAEAATQESETAAESKEEEPASEAQEEANDEEKGE